MSGIRAFDFAASDQGFFRMTAESAGQIQEW